MGLASGATPSSSPNTNSSYDEADYISLPPAVARTLSFRSVSRTPRNSSQFPFPYVVDMQAGNVYQESTATVNRTSSLATIRQSMAYLQSFDDPPLTPGGVNWMLQQQQLQLQQQQQQQPQPQPGQDGYVGTPVVELPGPIFNRGFSLAGITPISTQTAAKPEDSQNPSLSRESSRSSVKSPGSVGSVPERPERPPTNRQPSQATITQASFNASAATRDHTHPSPPPLIRKESQTTIKLHSVPEDTYSPSIPSTTTPDEPHLHIPPSPSPHAHRAHHHHHHHHHNQQPKSSIYDTTGSSFSWSTASHEPDPRYDRLLFDYRVIAQSMHAYRHISIFRRFGRLSMANLLYYQDELTCIERALSHVDMEETRWAQTGVSESDSEKQELRETRIKLMKMLQDKLKSYYEALLLQEQIFTSLDPPRPIDSRLLAALEDPSSSPSDSNPFTGAPNSDDLVALGLGGRDSLEKLVGRLVPALFPHRNPSVEDVRHRNLSQKDMASILSPFTRRITRLIIALATTALMLGPMVILQFVTSATWKLVCISLFTVVLALLVALATRGRGEAIVMVVAAYAAVLVVFVQGNQGCGGVVPTIGAGGAGGAGGG